MVQFKRRMPRFEKIPILKLSSRNKKDIDKQIFEKNIITVIRLRHIKTHFTGYDELVTELLEEKLSDDVRTKEILFNRSRIKDCNDYDTLFSYLSTVVGNDAITFLIQKLRGLNTNLFKDVLKKMSEGFNNTFIDNALLILANEFKFHDIGNEILNLLKSNIFRDPINFSSILMILGHSNNIDYIDILYSFYIFFKDNFPGEECIEGPLLAIKDLLYNEEIMNDFFRMRS